MDFKYVGKICPLRIGHMIMPMRSGCRRNCQWYPTGDVRTHNSRTDSLRILKLFVGVTMWPAMYYHWTRSKGQRSRSQCHKVT